MQALLLRTDIAERVHICSVPLVAMAEGGATSGWRSILRGRRELAAINHELGIVAPAWRRYWAKLSFRLGRCTAPRLLPKYQES